MTFSVTRTQKLAAPSGIVWHALTDAASLRTWFAEDALVDLGFQCGNLMAHLEGGAGIVRPDFTDPSPEVRLSIAIDAPLAVVWETLLDPARVAEWLSAPQRADRISTR